MYLIMDKKEGSLPYLIWRTTEEVLSTESDDDLKFVGVMFYDGDFMQPTNDGKTKKHKMRATEYRYIDGRTIRTQYIADYVPKGERGYGMEADWEMETEPVVSDVIGEFLVYAMPWTDQVEPGVYYPHQPKSPQKNSSKKRRFTGHL